ncbi:MAG TPA: PEP/pyruvate-binding domain-containing protein [Vicinamibacterales bacterium]|nr:PEP/pyruvate-binding domain-containing protein [Vicinamibacterales bacterium]
MDQRNSPRIVPLDQLTAVDESLSGAKAYNCARLKQAGCRVPDGLVVLSTATAGDLTTISEHRWFDGLPDGELFAVRSSGIGEDSGQSFAGIHQTILNVRRVDVGEAVAACQASAHTIQALEYRRAKGLSTDSIQIAVLVQRMIQPLASGVAFTANPLTGSEDELVINASWGVGEALVSGQVDPDEFVVRKRDLELIWSRGGEKASDGSSSTFSLSPIQLRELAAVLVAIERHYDAPQDVEWCHDGRQFWIVQSRPVTTGGTPTNEIEWTRANLAEVLPDLTSPQALSAFEDLLNRAERQYMGRLAAPEAELGPMLKTFYGRLYFNLSQLRRVCAVTGTSPAVLLKSMGHADAIQPSDETPARVPVRERLSALPHLIRMARRHLRAARVVREHDAKFRARLDALTAVDPQQLSDAEIWAAVERWLSEGPEHMQTVLMLGGVVFHETPVRNVCDQVGFSFEQLVYPQLATGERSVSTQQAFDLMELAETARREPPVVEFLSNEISDLLQFRIALGGTEFLNEFKRFLEAYGHRGHYESDWSLPRYSDDPSPLLRAIRAHVTDPVARTVSEITLRQQRESAEAWSAFTHRLSAWQRWTTLPRVRRGIQNIKQYYVWRERVRSDMVRVLATMRKWHLVLAERFVERGWIDTRDDYFLLHLDEIAPVIKASAGPDTLRTAAALRTRELARYRSIQMPLLMRESELARLIRTAGVSSRSADESQLTGHPVSGGCVEAEVVVVRDPGDFNRMRPGAILVAPATDPSWTPLFTLASGVIVEVGGVLSHASTIAREYGLPALANVKHATKRLKTGERVRLDAINGIVERLQAATTVDDAEDLVPVGIMLESTRPG